MASSLFFGGSVVAAVVAGMIALFAPCCISVMLPAYFASSFQNRRLLVAMTFVFAAGVTSVILPIALGASLVRQLLTEQHTLLYVSGGLLMLALGGYVLLGGQIHLPMPGRRTGGQAGVASVYTLGIFSGMASACCKPVLAGVIALASVAASFGLALGLGIAYVFGMVAPLFVIALLWERLETRTRGLFRPRSVTWRLGPLQRALGLTDLASGVLLAVIGVGMVWIGFSAHSMPALTGWQEGLTAWLQHLGTVLTRAFAWLPGWLVALMLAGVIGGLAWRAWRQLDDNPPDRQESHADARDGAPGAYADSIRQHPAGDQSVHEPQPTAPASAVTPAGLSASAGASDERGAR